MDFAQRQHRPGRRFTGIGVVVLLHLMLGWVLVSGLAHHIVQVAPQAPVEIKLIQPETPPPPSPKMALLPLPTLSPPPPRFIPPPEVQVTQPPETTVAATAIPQPSPGAGTEAAPQPGRGQPGGALVRTPLQLDFSKCGSPAYPDIDVQGTTMVVFTMDITGAISEARVAESSGQSRRHKVLDRLAVNFVLSCKGTPGTVNGKPVPLRGITPITWNLKD